NGKRSSACAPRASRTRRSVSSSSILRTPASWKAATGKRVSRCPAGRCLSTRPACSPPPGQRSSDTPAGRGPSGSSGARRRSRAAVARLLLLRSLVLLRLPERDRGARRVDDHAHQSEIADLRLVHHDLRSHLLRLALGGG